MDARWEVASSPEPCWLVPSGMAGTGERPAFRGPLSFIYSCGCYLAPAPENLPASLPFDSNLEKSARHRRQRHHNVERFGGNAVSNHKKRRRPAFDSNWNRNIRSDQR